MGNKGANALARVIREQAGAMFNQMNSSTVLGTVSGSSIILDNFEIPIPIRDFLLLEQRITLSPGNDTYSTKLVLRSGDRVLCVPAGPSTFVIIGQVK